MEHINLIRKILFSLWNDNSITDSDYQEAKSHLDALENKVLPQTNVIIAGKVKELLLFSENDGTIVNGYRTKEIIQELKTLITNDKNTKS